MRTGEKVSSHVRRVVGQEMRRETKEGDRKEVESNMIVLS